MNSSRESQLASYAWFPEATLKNRKSGFGSALGKLAIGLLIAFILFRSHHFAIAYAICAISLLLFVLTFAVPRIQQALDALLLRFGRVVGGTVGVLLLGITYLCFITPMRFVRRLFGSDDLQMRDSAKLSFWLPCDADRRKVRYIGTMFTSEVHSRQGRPVLVIATTIFMLLLIAEGILRIEGYSTAVNYVADPLVGYYTEPNVNVRHRGNLILTNQYGMRSHSFDVKKAPGVFRILMLGDSTLYGGSYVDQADLYSTRLEEQLNRKLKGRKIEVLAMGVNGWGPFHERGYISKFGTFDADLAIVNLPIDDINRPLYGLMSIPFSAVQTPPRLALEQLLNHYMWEYRKTHAGLDAKWEAGQSQLGIQEYGKLADDLQSHGLEVVFACLPGRDPGFGMAEAEPYGQWRKQLQQSLAQRNVQMLFPTGLFVGKGKPDEIYHDDVHLQPAGHHLYADFLEARVLSDSKRLSQYLSEETR